MALFKYQALTEGGRLMKGSLEAGSQVEAAALLEQMPLKISSLEATEVADKQRRIGRQDFLLFNQQLAALTKAGIPLERGLRELSQDIASQKMRSLVADIATDMEAGTPIEEAFERRAKHFPPLYGQLLKAGVETGRLGEMLTSLNRQVELTGQTRRMVIEALTYPAMILFITAVITSFLYARIIPVFVEIVRDMIGGQLSTLTAFVFHFSQHVMPFWIVLGVIFVGYIFVWKLLALSPGGRRCRETVLIHTPVLGRIYHSGALARLAETMIVSVTAGCPLSESLRMSAYATSSESLTLECENVAQQLESGQPILTAGVLCHQLPRFFLYSIQLGIQRNDVTSSLQGLSRMYSEQARYGQAHVQAVLAPLFIVVLGAIVALTVIGLFLPLIQMLTALSS